MKLIRLLMPLAMLAAITPGAFARHGPPPSVAGTWYVALDTEPFGPDVFEGLALSGLATFHRDGTFLQTDAGDFGQETFLQTKDSPQFGSWKFRWFRHGNGGWHRRIILTTWWLTADLEGEIQSWGRAEFDLSLSKDGQTLAGTVNVFALPCPNMLPTPLHCPDPIANADEFDLLPVRMGEDGPIFEPVPVTFTRLNAALSE